MTVFSKDEKDIVRIAVLASGRGSNFEALCRGDTGRGRIRLLITDKPDAPALKKAENLGVESMYIYPGKFRTKFTSDAELEWIEVMEEMGIELICLAGLMRIIKKNLLDKYAGKIMNIHPSLLPSFPGLHSQRQALEYGVKYSGCTVHYVDAGTDTGSVILQKTVPVLPNDTEESLSARILAKEHEAYSEAVSLHCSGGLVTIGRTVHSGSELNEKRLP